VEQRGLSNDAASRPELYFCHAFSSCTLWTTVDGLTITQPNPNSHQTLLQITARNDTQLTLTPLRYPKFTTQLPYIIDWWWFFKWSIKSVKVYFIQTKYVEDRTCQPLPTPICLGYFPEIIPSSGSKLATAWLRYVTQIAALLIYKRLLFWWQRWSVVNIELMLTMPHTFCNGNVEAHIRFFQLMGSY